MVTATQGVRTCLDAHDCYLYIVCSPVDRVVPHYRHAIFNRWIPNGATFNSVVEEMAGLMDCSRYLLSGMRGHGCGAIFTDA